MRVVANRAAETITADVPKRFSSLIIELPVQQTGSGDPSPENIRPIIQWTDVALYVADTDTAAEPTVTTTLPTPIFGGMVDVARGEVASLYNEKKSSSGWEMVEEGQFRCQVGAFNNGDETSTNVADLYSSHYKTVSNKDAYDATDDLTCGTPTIEGVTYLYVNDLDYTTLEAFTAYIGDVQFVYKSHVPMSDAIEPTIVYLSEGTSYVWAEGAFYTETVTGTPPLSLPNSVGKPLDTWNVELSPYQDLHGYDYPWPAGGGKNKANLTWGDYVPSINTGYDTRYSGWSTDYISVNSQNDYVVSKQGEDTGHYVFFYTDDSYLGYSTYGSSILLSTYENWQQTTRIRLRADGTSANNPMCQLELGTTATAWTPYSNTCPISGTDKVIITTAGKNLLNINRTEIIDTYEEGGSTAATTPRTFTENQIWIGLAFNNYFNPNRIDSYSVTSNSVTAKCNSTAYGIGFPLKCSSNMQFTLSHTASTDAYTSVVYYDKDGNILSYSTRTYTNVTYTTPANCTWMCVVLCPAYGIDTTYTNLQLEFGSTATDYMPYIATSSSTITIPSTIYNGQVSNDGAVSNWGEVDLGTLDWTKVGSATYPIWRANLQDAKTVAATEGLRNAICSNYKLATTGSSMYNGSEDKCFLINTTYIGGQGYIYVRDSAFDGLTGSDVKTALSGVQVAYELATPTTITITTPDIPTPRGNATTWATAEDGTLDSMSVTYVRKA